MTCCFSRLAGSAAATRQARYQTHLRIHARGLLPSGAGLRKLAGPRHSPGNRPITSICASAWTAPGNDETVFHQLLHWHHFYDKSTLAVGLVSDGLFHAGGFIAMVAGLFLLADAHRRGGFVPKRWVGRLAARGRRIPALRRDRAAQAARTAWNLPADGGPMASRHTGAELMYYGGTVIEVALAVVVMTHWYLVSGRALARTRHRSQSAGPQLPIALPSRRRGWAPLPLSHPGRISRGARAGHKRTPRAQQPMWRAPRAGSG
jgi:hypothetical protein